MGTSRRDAAYNGLAAAFRARGSADQLLIAALARLEAKLDCFMGLGPVPSGGFSAFTPADAAEIHEPPREDADRSANLEALLGWLSPSSAVLGAEAAPYPPQVPDAPDKLGDSLGFPVVDFSTVVSEPVIAAAVPSCDDEASTLVSSSRFKLDYIVRKVFEVAAPSEAAPSVAPAATVEFDIVLERQASGLGLCLSPVEGDHYLEIIEVTPGGLAERWNAANPESAVAPGSHIVAVGADTVTGAQAMLAAIRGSEEETIRLRIRSQQISPDQAQNGTKAKAKEFSTVVSEPVIEAAVPSCDDESSTPAVFPNELPADVTVIPSRAPSPASTPAVVLNELPADVTKIPPRAPSPASDCFTEHLHLAFKAEAGTYEQARAPDAIEMDGGMRLAEEKKMRNGKRRRRGKKRSAAAAPWEFNTEENDARCDVCGLVFPKANIVFDWECPLGCGEVFCDACSNCRCKLNEEFDGLAEASLEECAYEAYLTEIRKQRPEGGELTEDERFWIKKHWEENAALREKFFEQQHA